MASAHPTTLWTREFAHLLVMQMFFGFAWGVYFLLPKFLHVRLGLDAGDTGLVVAIAGVTAFAAIFPSGKLIDRIGRKPCVIIGTLFLALAGALFYFVHDVGPALVLAQICIGLGSAFGFNAAGTIAADSAPPGRTVQAVGLFGAANLAMNAVAPAVGEIVADSHGWSLVFAGSAFASLLATLLALGLREVPRPTPTLDDTARTVPPFSPPLLHVYAACFAFTSSFAALVVLTQPFALSQGMSEVRRIFLGFTLSALAIRIVMTTRKGTIGPLSATIASQVGYAFVPSLLFLVGPTFLFSVGSAQGLCHGILYPAITALALQRASVCDRGLVFAVINGTFNLGHAFFSFTLGTIADRAGFGYAFATASVITVAGLAPLVLSFPRTRESRV